MIRCKIFGAGSIGNHLTHAARHLDWEVVVCDPNPAAIKRMREEIYPARYGQWDEAIALHSVRDAPRGGFDLIIVGTPPDAHLPVAMDAMGESPKAILMEKPLCPPDMGGVNELLEEAEAAQVQLFTGYNHAVGQAANAMAAAIQDGKFGAVQTLDVEFREHWGGVFAAHPWLSGPADSYLGYWQRGGGASGEHSHAIHLWQFFAHTAGAGRVVEVQATLDYVKDGHVDYDQICLLQLRTENGLVGRVVQDVVTKPARKWARIQGANGFAEWHCGNPDGADMLKLGVGELSSEEVFRKDRPEDFILELRHLHDVLEDNDSLESPLSLGRGLEAMEVIKAAHKSHATGQVVQINNSSY